MNKENFTDFVRELKEKNDIVEVIGSYIKLERRGYNYWACCPFHPDKSPSFSINAADRYYHCFGCGASGDVIGFVKNYENVDFMQAVQILAARVKMEVPAYDDRTAEEAAAKKKKHDRLAALMKDAARFYLGNLYSGRADAHLAYLQKRGVSPSTARRFGIGASLDYVSLPSHLLAQGYTPEECVESGACSRTDEGRLIDAEGERLIIPIINHMDEVVAFGGRLLKKSDRAKYKNTRETMLFNKSRTLYNLNLVKKEKRAGGLSSIILVEGYMDAISFYEAGLHGVAASMGTSLTKEQARLLRRYTENVFISYDGDFAGQKANLRGLDILKQEGLKVRVVPLPEGFDPDDVIQKQGADGYRTCLDQAMPLIDFRLLAAGRKYDLSKTDEKREYVAEALGVVRDAESATEREELLKRISAETGVSMASLARDLEDLPRLSVPEAPEPAPVRDDDAGLEKKAARFVLAAALLDKPYARGCDLAALPFDDPAHRTIAGYVLKERRSGSVRASGIFDLLPADGELAEIFDLDYGDNLDSPAAEKYFADCVAALLRRPLSEKIAAARRDYENASTAEERRAALVRINEYTKELKNLSAGGKV